MVIQRWQSVLLLCAVVLQALFTFCSLGQLQGPDYTYNFISMGFVREGVATGNAATGYLVHTWYFFAVSLLTVVLPLIAIFCFKNFRLQRRLCLVEELVLVALITVAAVLGYNTLPGLAVSWSSIAWCPFLSMIATWMAYRRIVADNRKLESVNRFR